MRSYFCTRFHRRFVVRYFGGTRNLILWLLAVSLTVYALDSYLFGSSDASKSQLADLSQISTEVKSVDSSAAGSHPQPPQPGAAVAPAAAAAASGQHAAEPQSKSCGQPQECPAGEYSYLVRSGVERGGSPTICFNGHYAFSAEKNNGKRGFNMLVINDKTLAVEDTRQFDTYEDDAVFLRYLRLGVEDHHVILMATQDDATYHLSEVSKKWLQAFGSDKITEMQFRDSFVMLGQRGLASPGAAKQKLIARPASKEYPDIAEISGCIKLPLGELKPALELVGEPAAASGGSAAGGENAAVAGGSAGSFKVGQTVVNCGMPVGCAASAFPVHLFTGKENVDGPKICINGNYLFDAGVNNAGRGVNVVIFDTEKSEPVTVARYDTYESADDSVSLAKLLRSVSSKHLVIAVSHDDMQTQLSKDVMEAFEKVGSSYIKQVAFRDAWAFIGQPNINGFSPIEEIEFGGPDTWPSPVNLKICVSKQLAAVQKKPDVNLKKNSPKRVFCRKYDGYEDFCKGARLDEVLTPAVLANPAMSKNPIFDVPVVIIPGLSHVAALQQFEALLANPGIVQKMVTVMYDVKFEESGLLANFFGYGTVQLESSTKYIYLIEKALEEAWKLFPLAQYVILLEEEVIPTTDFLHYMSQCLPVLEKDATLIGATAWNENGFEGLSSMPDTVYRGGTFPGLGFMLKKSFYMAQMKSKMADCCLKRSWYGWFEGKLGPSEMLIPDVSRATRRQFMGLTENIDFVRSYFNRPRVTSKGVPTPLANVDDLIYDKYETLLNKLVADSIPLSSAKAGECASGKSTGFEIPATKGKSYTIYFEQDGATDEAALAVLCRCFGLFQAPGYHLKGLHQGLVRFTNNENHVLLVGSATPYYKNKPASHQPVPKSQLLVSAPAH